MDRKHNVIEESPEKQELRDLGYFLTWAIVLECFVGQDRNSSSEVKADVGNFIRKNEIVSKFLTNLFAYIQVLQRDDFPNIAILNTNDIVGSLAFDVTELRTRIPVLCSYLYYLTLQCFPVLVRLWFSDDLDRRTSSIVDIYTTKFISPHLLSHEIKSISDYSQNFENYNIKANQVTHEITAVYEKEEASLAIVITLPESYPLKSVDIQCTHRMGVADSLWRKWLLSMHTVFLTQDGSILNALLLWKSNLDKHFEGVECCPICYSLFHLSNYSLPNLACKTCKNKFHSACMYKWIKVAHKSECPICRDSLLS